jgi:hypothetical protein
MQLFYGSNKNFSVEHEGIELLKLIGCCANFVASFKVGHCMFPRNKNVICPSSVLLSMLGSDFSSFIELPANGSSGGILVGWRQSLGITREHHIDNHSVSVQFCPAEGQEWWLTCVYGSQGNERKIQFMQE